MTPECLIRCDTVATNLAWIYATINTTRKLNSHFLKSNFINLFKKYIFVWKGFWRGIRGSKVKSRNSNKNICHFSWLTAKTDDFFHWMDGWINGWMDGWMEQKFRSTVYIPTWCAILTFYSHTLFWLVGKVNTKIKLRSQYDNFWQKNPILYFDTNQTSGMVLNVLY